MPSMSRSIFCASTSPEGLAKGRSIWVMSPVMTALLPKPKRVRNIFICSTVVFCASSNMTNESFKVRPLMKASGSKAVITGDITQIDLPFAKPSGLVEAQKILRDIEGIEFVNFTEADVVRHPLVQEIIKAFEKAGKKKQKTIVEGI